MPSMSELLETAKDYWPFIIQVVVIWYLGQLFKKRVWTKKRALTSRFASFMRDWLPVWPIVAGGAWGLAWPWLPAVVLVTTRGGALCEGIFAGTLSVAAFTALEHYAERKRITWLLQMLREVVPAESLPPPREHHVRDHAMKAKQPVPPLPPLVRKGKGP